MSCLKEPGHNHKGCFLEGGGEGRQQFLAAPGLKNSIEPTGMGVRAWQMGTLSWRKSGNRVGTCVGRIVVDWPSNDLVPVLEGA
jgi:hypothetical protein